MIREHFPEFRNCHVSMVAPQAGVRETRRIRGVHVISGEEYVNGVRYPDSVSRGAHPIDIHAASGATQQVTFLKQPAYVPYRALVAAGFDVDRKNIALVGEPLVKQVGTYEAAVKCYKDIKATVKFEVVPEEA